MTYAADSPSYGKKEGPAFARGRKPAQQCGRKRPPSESRVRVHFGIYGGIYNRGRELCRGRRAMAAAYIGAGAPIASAEAPPIISQLAADCVQSPAEVPGVFCAAPGPNCRSDWTARPVFISFRISRGQRIAKLQRPRANLPEMKTESARPRL